MGNVCTSISTSSKSLFHKKIKLIFIYDLVSGGRVRGRQRLGWMDGVKVALGNRGMTVEAARKTGESG